MLPEQRKRRLLELVTERGGADVAYLSTALEVSPATIRRDLSMLESTGRIQRTHGGAVLPHASTAFEPLHSEKAGRNRREKELIARHAARQVGDGEVVILDSGSTTLALASELKKKQNLAVITNDLKIALELCDTPGFDVIVLGGLVRPSLYSVIGPAVEEALLGYNANHSFLAADAVTEKGDLTNASLEEVPIKRLMMKSSLRSVLLADHSKFARASLARVANLSEFDEVVTDENLDPRACELLREAGVHLTLATGECSE